MKEIDFENWERKEFFEFYSKQGISRYHITTPLDVTKLYHFAHKNKISFYFALQHVFMTAINEIEEFNIKIINNKLVVKNGKFSSCTYLKKGETLFKIVATLYMNDIIKFCQNAKSIANTQTRFIEDVDYNEIISIFSCTPWFEYTNLESPKISLNDDFTPKIIWDKIKDVDNKKFVNVDIDVNHRVIDGFLLAKLLEKVNLIIESL